MRKLAVLASVGALATTVAVAQPAAAVDEINTKRLRNAVTVSGILGHERVFQRIANQNGGTRASGTPGYDASAAYVATTLRNAGYDVTTQEFTFPFWRSLSPATLAVVTPTPRDIETAAFTYSPSGTVTGTLVPIDVEIPPTAPAGETDSGCEPGDFPTAPAGPAVALIQRGGCTFQVKTELAAAAGYDAVIIFNEGQEGRTDLFIGTLGAPQPIPVVGASFADASALVAAAAAGPVTVTVTTDTETNLQARTTNVFAETPGGDPNRVIMAGAHLDSVPAGPGINDNGSGSAGLLEIAEQITALNLRPRQKVRFAFWGAEEGGLLGSEHYVETLSDTELQRIYAYLNFDMIGSPNYVRFVYDGDASEIPIPPGTVVPPGSAQIEEIFESYFAAQGLESDPTEFSGRSDYGPFIAAGIPSGGLFTGAEGIKTAEQAAIYGGTAGEPYDACYHQACDTIANLNTKALNEMGDAAADAIWTLARTRTGFFEDGSLRVATKKAVNKAAKAEAHAAR